MLGRSDAQRFQRGGRTPKENKAGWDQRRADETSDSQRLEARFEAERQKKNIDAAE